MPIFIGRSWNRTEKDDYKLNVEDKIGKMEGSIEQYDSENNLIGWIIKLMYD